jgi:hypothetical protein
MSRETKSPQEKKRLSLERDRQNDYGENAKSSRKNIPLSRALSHRSIRKDQNQSLRGALVAATEEQLAEAELRSKEEKPQWWRKHRDAPLGEVVAQKLERRRQSPRKK